MSKQKFYIGIQEVEFNNKFNVKMQVSDIRNPEIGSSNKSYTLNIPLTKENNEILKRPFDIRETEQIEDIARLLIDDIEIIRGKLRLTNSSENYANGIIEADQWIDLIKNTSLRDLSWVSGDSHVFSGNNVLATWTAGAGSFYRYPMINYGNLFSGERSSTAKVVANDFVAAWNIQDIVTKIFADAGYLLDTNGFFHSTFGQKLYILSQEPIAESGFIEDKNLDAQVNLGTDNRDTISHPSGAFDRLTIANDPMIITNEIEDEGSDYSSNQYTVPETGTYRFQAGVKIFSTHNTDSAFINVTNSIIFVIEKGSTAIAEVTSSDVTAFDIGNETYEIDTGYIFLEVGDVIKCTITLETTAINSSTTRPAYLYVNSGTTGYLKNVWDNNCLYSGIGKTIDPENYLPEIDSVTFLKGLKQVANLKFWADEFNKTIHILDADNFVGSTVKDWVDRQDHSQEITAEVIASSFNKTQKLQYKGDSSDRAYTEFISSNNEPFTKEIILANEYAKDGEKINENAVFASTVIGDFRSVINFSNNIPRIWGSGDQHENWSFPNNRATSWMPRLLQWDGLTTLTTGAYKFHGDWDDAGTAYSTFAKASTPDMSDMYDSYWIKYWRYVDNSRLLGVTVYVNQNELAEFMTVISARDEEGFGATYKLNIDGNDMLFILNNLVTDGIKAKCEFTQKM